MKKIVVLAAALSLFATPVLAASIVNSAHDLSANSTFVSKDGTATYGATETDQLCVFCHTPHGALAVAPLWNRNAADLSAATAYDSATFDFTPVYTSGDVPLCMSCHDGNMTDALVNLNGAASGALTPSTDDTLTIPAGLPALIGTDFSNDHPVGFVYDAGADLQNGLHPITTPAVALLMRGAGSNEVWCASCHNVHDPGTGGTVPFLRVTNANSALCLTCHNK